MPLSLQAISVDQLESQDLQESKRVLSAIEAAFGPDAPGILLVNGLHSDYIADRTSFLSAGRALAALPPHELKELQFGADNFLGWSRGREMFKGRVDNQKASFYANPIYDHPAGGSNHLVSKYPYVSLSNHHMSLMRSLFKSNLKHPSMLVVSYANHYSDYMCPNIWPTHSSCARLEPCFKKLGRYINQVGLLVARRCDDYVQLKLGHGANFSRMQHSLEQSTSAKGRLLNYFPPDDSMPTHTNSDEQLWCGYHNDHGTLTGLIAGQFYNTSHMQSQLTAPDSVSGLYVCRGYKPEKVVIPEDCLAFQIGESAQIVSGGMLRATPHAVLMPRCARDVARITLVVFLQPNPWEKLSLPCGDNELDVERALETNARVPDLKERYEVGDTFAEFAAKTGKAYTAYGFGEQ